MRVSTFNLITLLCKKGFELLEESFGEAGYGSATLINPFKVIGIVVTKDSTYVDVEDRKTGVITPVIKDQQRISCDDYRRVLSAIYLN